MLINNHIFYYRQSFYMISVFIFPTRIAFLNSFFFFIILWPWSKLAHHSASIVYGWLCEAPGNNRMLYAPKFISHCSAANHLYSKLDSLLIFLNRTPSQLALGFLAKVVCARFPHCKVTLFSLLSHCIILFEKKSLWPGHI